MALLVPSVVLSLRNQMMFNYQWNMTEYPEKNGYTVMSTFACGGGSTMGYKLAGFDVVAANDIDPQMKRVYEANHHPKQYFLEDIRSLIVRTDLPQVDILDGSPPCSVFSTAGNREADWGKEKKFREGQNDQTLDDLFFHFITLAKQMQPKIVVSENVKGLLQGNAKGYVKQIFQAFDQAGYDTQLFLLNSATMGVPQRRQRVFFISRRKDLKLPMIELNFNEPPIPFNQVSDNSDTNNNLSKIDHYYWFNSKPGGAVGRFFARKKLVLNEVSNTIAASKRHCHPTHPRTLNDIELLRIGAFPQDYNFMGISANYLIGMSVPPVMMANVAEQVKKQWLDKI